MFWTGRVASGDTLRRALRKWGVTIGVASGLAAGVAWQPVQARGPQTASPAAIAAVELTALPGEAQATHRLIRAGGPFPYRKDGITFGNRERLLPPAPLGRRSYYREYTVTTPSADHRGARRIVCGGVAPRQPQACYYTDDHYASFRRITP